MSLIGDCSCIYHYGNCRGFFYGRIVVRGFDYLNTSLGTILHNISSFYNSQGHLSSIIKKSLFHNCTKGREHLQGKRLARNCLGRF